MTLTSNDHIDLQRIMVEAGKMAQEIRQHLQIELKPDGSVVTNADKEIETFLRSELKKIAPEAAIWGEEYGFEEMNSHGAWLIDPIDGTTNYSVGQPLWGITIAFMQNGKLQSGLVSLPDLNWHFAAQSGHGATMNDSELKPSKTGAIANHELVGDADDMRGTFDFIPGKRRHFGAFVAEAMFLAQGYFRAMTCTKAKLYDAAGSLVILREVGLQIKTLSGNDFEEAGYYKNIKLDPIAILPQNSNLWLR